MNGLDRTLVSGTLTVRPCRPADREAVIQGRDEEIFRFLGKGSDDPAPVGCICVDDVLVGWIDNDSQRDWLDENEINVGYAIFPDHRNRGYGSRALELFCAYLAARHPSIIPTLLIDPANKPSLAVAARAGFEATGMVDGQYLYRPGRGSQSGV